MLPQLTHSLTPDAAAMITTADAAALTQVFAETEALPTDLPAQRRMLAGGLATLIGADVWMWAQGANSATNRTGMGFSIVDGGWESPEQRSRFFEMLGQPHWFRMVSPAADAAWAVQPLFTRLRQELVSDEAWYGSPAHRDGQAVVGIDYFLVSFYVLSPTLHSGMGFWRKTGRPAFAERERTLVHLASTAAERLHRAGLNVPAAARVAGLSPRLRHILVLVLSGDERREIAAKTELSPHTVNDYLKALYVHFGVNSRAALMALFLPTREDAVTGGQK